MCAGVEIGSAWGPDLAEDFGGPRDGAQRAIWGGLGRLTRLS